MPVGQVVVPVVRFTHTPFCIVWPVGQVVVWVTVHPPVPLATPLGQAVVVVPAARFTHMPFCIV